MRFLHISDLHLGKRVHEFSMIEDQKYILNQILQIVESEMIDAVLIAGDIYDKSVPSAEAVQVFDAFLTSLAKKKVTTFIISGNHDSAERIAFGAEIMSGQNIHVAPVYNGKAKQVCIKDAYGDLEVYLLPFVKPATVRHAFADTENEEKIDSYQSAVAMAVQSMEVDSKKRNVLVAHQFVTGALRCESEEIVVGGLDQIDVQTFADFDYVALGHLHSPQKVEKETVRYCGSPLKYSFSEANQTKSVTILDMQEKGNVQLKTVALTPLRDMRKIKGTYLEVTHRSFYQRMSTKDYVHITLTDEEDIPDGVQKLRIIYPNLMRLEYDNLRTRKNQEINVTEDIKQKSELELFAEFYEVQNNQSMSEEQGRFVRELIETMK